MLDYLERLMVDLKWAIRIFGTTLTVAIIYTGLPCMLVAGCLFCRRPTCTSCTAVDPIFLMECLIF